MSFQFASDLLSDAVLACADSMSKQLTSEVDRLIEEFQANLLSKLNIANANGQLTFGAQLRSNGLAADEQPNSPRSFDRIGENDTTGFDEAQARMPGVLPPVPLPKEVPFRDEQCVVHQQPVRLLTSSTGSTVSSTQSAFHVMEHGLDKLTSDGSTPSFGMAAPVIEEHLVSVHPSKGSEKSVMVLEDAVEHAVDTAPSTVEAESKALVMPEEVPSSQRWSLDTLERFSSEKFSRTSLGTIVTSRYFEIFFGFLILLNCAVMGLQAEQTVAGSLSDFYNVFFDVTEHFFTAIFTIELLMRLTVYGWRAFVPCSAQRHPDTWWHVMDSFLVVFTGILFSWVIPLMELIIGSKGEFSGIRTITTLRAARLLRLARVVQRVPEFREVWLLLRGLTDSMRTLFWTCVVIVSITYVFAVFGLVLIATELTDRRDATVDESLRRELTELLSFVGGLDNLMYTLIQLLTLDSWNSIIRRLVAQIWWCWAFFYAYIAVAVIVMMNLVTAIIVENAVTNSMHDEDQQVKEREKAKLGELRSLEHLFTLMDADGSGTLSWHEFKMSFHDADLLKRWKLLDFDPEECKELFGLLDDGDGEIETSEFFEGLAQMKGVAQSKDLFRLRKYTEKLRDMINDLKPGWGWDAEDPEGHHPESPKGGRKSRRKSEFGWKRQHSPLRVEAAPDAHHAHDAALAMIANFVGKESKGQEPQAATEFKEAIVQTEGDELLPVASAVKRRRSPKTGKKNQAFNETEMPMLIPSSATPKLSDEGSAIQVLLPSPMVRI